MLPARRKQPTETRTLTFYFTEKLASGDTVASLTSLTASAGLTVGSGSLSSNRVTVQASGGTAGNDYTVQCRVTTTQADILELDVTVEVRDDAN